MKWNDNRLLKTAINIKPKGKRHVRRLSFLVDGPSENKCENERQDTDRGDKDGNIYIMLDPPMRTQYKKLQKCSLWIPL
jgi:hypothetical protein